jgi:NAD kinase
VEVILTPDVKVVITPIAPHNLNARPLPDETEIRLKVFRKRRALSGFIRLQNHFCKNESILTLKLPSK